MTERLALAQARERLAALTSNDSVIDPASIDWTQPARDAITYAGLMANYYDERENIVAVCLVLLGYQAHLDHEAGRAFELAAVRRAAQLGIGAADSMDGEAFLRFDDALAKGYHHAEPSTPVVQMGDVWRIGAMVASDVEVRCVHAATGNLTVSAVHGKDRAHKVVSTAKFTSNRRLVKRDGKAV